MADICSVCSITVAPGDSTAIKCGGKRYHGQCAATRGLQPDPKPPARVLSNAWDTSRSHVAKGKQPAAE